MFLRAANRLSTVMCTEGNRLYTDCPLLVYSYSRTQSILWNLSAQGDAKCDELLRLFPHFLDEISFS